MAEASHWDCFLPRCSDHGGLLNFAGECTSLQTFNCLSLSSSNSLCSLAENESSIDLLCKSYRVHNCDTRTKGKFSQKWKVTQDMKEFSWRLKWDFSDSLAEGQRQLCFPGRLTSPPQVLRSLGGAAALWASGKSGFRIVGVKESVTKNIRGVFKVSFRG